MIETKNQRALRERDRDKKIDEEVERNKKIRLREKRNNRDR